MSEDTFRKLEEEGPEQLGPAAVLLCGFAGNEEADLRTLLSAAAVSAHRLVFCTEGMLKGTLELALSGESSTPPLPPQVLPRVMVLSGMQAAQISAVVDGYAATGLPRPIFASVTRTNLSWPVRDLLRDLLREHTAMNRRG